MVCYAMAIARRAPEFTPARIRIPSYAVWDTVVFVLNVLAFVFIGLQVRPILAGLDAATRTLYLQVAARGPGHRHPGADRLGHDAQRASSSWKIRRYGFHPPRPTLRPTVGSGLVVSWSGMRGIVSLAAALALPITWTERLSRSATSSCSPRSRWCSARSSSRA